jgi:type II restriction/modification system DNA methylase subunit YeeA
MTPDQFIRKWTASKLSERAAAQQHFVDLCTLLGEKTPAEADPEGETFAFERGGTTATGGHGWADVWKKGVFAWEYKGPGKDLNAAYLQLKKYADMLENPPLLITSDTKRIEIHTNFTNTIKTVHVLEIDDLANPAKREVLRAAFTEPEKLRPGVTRQQVTKEAAERFSALAHQLHAKGIEPHHVAHFLNRLIFCMFAEDVGLLPNRIFTRLVTASVTHPESFEENARQLFAGMASGGDVAFEVIDWFNGGLFDDDSTLPLDKVELQLVLKCAELDWSNIEPSIFGTLFERGLDPDKRSQQGAHYTDPDTIMKIVRPVVVEPWEREWELEKAAIAKQADRAKKTVSEAAKQRYFKFLERLVSFKVLDPACGSGNFLYLALRSLKDFEKRVVHEAETLGLPPQFPRVGPEAVLGIEVNPYAAELARVTIWIGELQWMIENGFGASRNPILKPLEQIECRDAVLNENGSEPEWPKADVIVGNPPFLGDRKMIRGLGEQYVTMLRNRYEERVPGGADLCCYWFEKARQAIEAGNTKATGLVATNSIRGGANRAVLDRITSSIPISEAWSDEDWINEGAAVRVSLVCFSRNTISIRLNGQSVLEIHPDLTGRTATGGADLTKAKKLAENRQTCFYTTVKAGSFDVPGSLAREWLLLPNPHGRPNSDVIKPWSNAMDVTRRPSGTWIVDFGVSMTEADACLYEAPFAYVKKTVKPERDKTRREKYRRMWWLLAEPIPGLRDALKKVTRFIATPQVSKHRVFVWMPTSVLPDHQLMAIARDDDTTFGILQSRMHELWALRLGSSLEDRPRYTPTTTFETFPFPDGFAPNQISSNLTDPRALAIAAAAKRLNELRENWLNPPELVERIREVVAGFPDRLVPKDSAAESDLKKRTLTNLYNAQPSWLQHLHRDLDKAVASAYGWEWPIDDGEILSRLLDLNQKRGGNPEAPRLTTKRKKRNGANQTSLL